MKHQKLFAAILAVSMVFSTIHANIRITNAETTSNPEFGNGVYWEFSEGVLTISGSGETGSAYMLPVSVPPVPVSADTLTEWQNSQWADIADQIKHLVIQDGITHIGSGAFCFLPELETVFLPDSLKSMGHLAFMGCPKLSEVKFPEEIQVTDDSFAYDCSLYNEENPFFVINGTILAEYGGTKQEKISIPPGVEVILSNTFREHSEMKAVCLPDSLRQIGTSAFQDCISLETVDFSENSLQMESSVFKGCSKLCSVELPEGIEKIEANTFQKCSALQTVFLPESIQIIGQCAFSGCTQLTEINFPQNLLEIQSDAFRSCNGLKDENGFLMLGTQAVIGYEGDWRMLCIPEGAEFLADNFSSYSTDADLQFISVICPESLRILSKGAFQNCGSLMEIVLNDGLETIAENALSGCKNLTELVIPSSVTKIEPQEQCSLQTIYGTPDTEAEKFAERYGLQFHDKKELDIKGTDMTFDYAKDGWSFGNSGAVFGGSYYLNATDRQALADSGISVENIEGAWSGSCAGLSVTAILAKNGIFTPEQFRHGAKTLSDLQGTPDVLSFINYFQCIGGRNGISSSYTKDIQKLYNAQKIAKNVPNGASPFLLVIPTASSSHAVVGYGHEEGTWEYAGKSYDARILIWDSNFPQAINEDACLYYDTKTFDYCIPYYGIHVAQGANDNSGELITVCNDLNILNAYPYPFDGHTPYEPVTGDLNLDGTVTVGDAVLLARLVAGDSTLHIARQAVENADMDADGMFTTGDLTMILKKIVSAD